MEMTGAEAILACLKAEQIPVVFGYPGGAVLGLYDAIYKTKFPHILTGHEQGAIHAADGYARAKGKVGVCIATTGQIALGRGPKTVKGDLLAEQEVSKGEKS